MKAMLKYHLELDGQSHLLPPLPEAVKHVGEQNGAVTLWAEASESDAPGPPETYYRVFATGEPVPESYSHVGTFQDGQFVWHIYGRYVL